jgi:hypothetical protein
VNRIFLVEHFKILYGPKMEIENVIKKHVAVEYSKRIHLEKLYQLTPRYHNFGLPNFTEADVVMYS